MPGNVFRTTYLTKHISRNTRIYLKKTLPSTVAWGLGICQIANKGEKVAHTNDSLDSTPLQAQSAATPAEPSSTAGAHSTVWSNTAPAEKTTSDIQAATPTLAYGDADALAWDAAFEHEEEVSAPSLASETPADSPDARSAHEELGELTFGEEAEASEETEAHEGTTAQSTPSESSLPTLEHQPNHFLGDAQPLEEGATFASAYSATGVTDMSSEHGGLSSDTEHSTQAPTRVSVLSDPRNDSSSLEDAQLEAAQTTSADISSSSDSTPTSIHTASTARAANDELYDENSSSNISSRADQEDQLSQATQALPATEQVTTSMSSDQSGEKSSASLESESGAHDDAAHDDVNEWRKDPGDPDLTDIPEKPASRIGAHIGSIFATLILLPIAWYLISDAGIRLNLVENSPWETGSVHIPVLIEFVGAMIAIFLLWLMARASSLGAQLWGILVALAGLTAVVVPQLGAWCMKQLDVAIGSYNGFTGNIVHHLDADLGSGRIALFGLLLFLTGAMIHAARKSAARRAEALTLRKQAGAEDK